MGGLNRRHPSRHVQDGDLASVPRRHEGTDHHDPAEKPSKGGHTNPAPTGRLYANEMVDKPYTRFGITDDAESHIVPTLIRQER